MKCANCGREDFQVYYVVRMYRQRDTRVTTICAHCWVTSFMPVRASERLSTYMQFDAPTWVHRRRAAAARQRAKNKPLGQA